MPTINVTVQNKIASASGPIYICGNSDYTVAFSFDAEWAEYETKTARFIYAGGYIDVVFTGSECAMPIISDTNAILIGVFAGNLHTTTAARIPAQKSILCGCGSPAKPSEDVYAQIMETLNDIQKHMDGLDGEDGKSAYEIAVEHGFKGTEEEWLESLQGEDGEDGHSPVRGEDYWTDADKAEIVRETKNYGTENAGKLVYVGGDGVAITLGIGAGLKIVNGVLMLDGTAKINTSVLGRARLGNMILNRGV